MSFWVCAKEGERRGERSDGGEEGGERRGVESGEWEMEGPERLFLILFISPNLFTPVLEFCVENLMFWEEVKRWQEGDCNLQAANKIFRRVRTPSSLLSPSTSPLPPLFSYHLINICFNKNSLLSQERQTK